MSAWFDQWFDSPYYPMLYQHRDDTEAQLFIHNLLVKLQLSPTARLLDMACGRGRHSIQLARRGYTVVGMDLSAASIADANQLPDKPEGLSFGVWDMRRPFAADFGHFDAVLNLFTSFGYFETELEHHQTLSNMAQALHGHESRLVIDFFNAPKVIRQLVLSETKTVQGIDFQLQRLVENGYITKNIRFTDQGQHFSFQEKVRAFTLHDWKAMLQHAGLRLLDHFGNYLLHPYDEQQSDRLILIAGKQA